MVNTHVAFLTNFHSSHSLSGRTEWERSYNIHFGASTCFDHLFIHNPFLSVYVKLLLCSVHSLFWYREKCIRSFSLFLSSTLKHSTHTHTHIRWQMRHAHKRLVGIRDRAETKELIFTRKIFSLNRDLRRLRVPVSFFLVVSPTIAPFLLLLLLLHRCYRSKKKIVCCTWNRVEIHCTLCGLPLFVSWAHSSYILFSCIYLSYGYNFYIGISAKQLEESTGTHNFTISYYSFAAPEHIFNEIVATTTTAECTMLTLNIRYIAIATFACLPAAHLQCTM